MNYFIFILYRKYLNLVVTFFNKTQNYIFSSFILPNFKYKTFSLNFYLGGGRYYSSLKKPKKLSNFLIEISDIINENKLDLKKAQYIIEKKWIDFNFNSLNIDESLYSKNSSIVEKGFEILVMYYNSNAFRRLHKDIKSNLLHIEHIFITLSILTTFYKRSNSTNIEILIGENVLKNIYFKNFKSSTEYKSYEDFKNITGVDNKRLLNIGHILASTFTSPNNNIFENSLNMEYSYQYQINDAYIDSIKDHLIISPQSLPMLCKPNLWSRTNKGGNLIKELNLDKDLITGSDNHSHKTKINQKMYNAINKLNSQEFLINNDLIDYLDNDGKFILDYYKNLDHNVYSNNLFTLDIAKVYSNIPFYLNVNIDWRGRIYTQSFYLDYQGSEFSLALLNINKYEKLTEQGKFFFYIYGANVYNEKNIGKQTFEEKYKWITNNLDRIYTMDKNFILNAENPTLFAAFCLNMQKLRDDSNYAINMPIFLDATCNGVQHFAAMILDSELANYVNLVNENDNVNDFYEKTIPAINQAINNSWMDKSDPDLVSFKDIKLTRNEVKRAIMTKSYNVTTFGISEQLKSILPKISRKIEILRDDKLKEITVYNYKVPALNEEGFVELDIYKIDKLADIINNNIFNQFPILYDIYTYLTKICKIYMKLGLPFSWNTPSGLELTQRYNLSEIQKVTINLLGKNRTAVLRNWTNDIDTRKEVQAIIPNIIHSLDASHLNLVINNWNNYILPIHDCFGTHPNNMEDLANLVRLKFVEIYAKKDYLKNIDKNFKMMLKENSVELVLKNHVECVKIPKKDRYIYLEVPKLPVMGNLDIKDIIIKGKYMIS